jgi:integrase/recombinase XerD
VNKVEEFRDYLKTIGYSHHISYELPNLITHFLNYLKSVKEKTLSKVSKRDIDDYIEIIKYCNSDRTKIKRGAIQINNYIYALRQFNKFYYNIYSREIPIQHIEYLKEENRYNRTPLTVEEIKKLFDATDNTKYGMRDRVMLTLFYSCGLRRNEGVNVNTTDIDLKKRIIFVRNGKFGKQRYVPFTEQSKQYLEEYLNIGRRQFVRKAIAKKRKTLFISYRGKSLDSQSLLQRLKQLSEKASIESKVGLHILRHSIATHLLQNGMSIYNIADFLGHKSIESTQIYTHITEDDF